MYWLVQICTGIYQCVPVVIGHRRPRVLPFVRAPVGVKTAFLA